MRIRENVQEGSHQGATLRCLLVSIVVSRMKRLLEQTKPISVNVDVQDR